MPLTQTDHHLLDPSPELVRPLSISVDGGIEEARARRLVQVAQQL